VEPCHHCAPLGRGPGKICLSHPWVSGRLVDRYGPRQLFPLGALCLGSGFILSVPAHTPWHLGLTCGVRVGQCLHSIGFVPHLTQMSWWFHQRHGLVSGLVLSAAGMGTLTLVPGGQYLASARKKE
jgi:MFS family permease